MEINFTDPINDLIYFVHYPEKLIIHPGDYYIDMRIGALKNVT
jgi:hypothetical protein